MNILIKDITMPLDHEKEDVFKVALKKAGVSEKDVNTVNINKKSIDARGGRIKFIYSVGVNLEKSDRIKFSDSVVREEKFEYVIKRNKALPEERPIIVGFGPAGLFCAYLLSLYGFKPILLEQGKSIEERKKDVDLFFEKRIFNPSANIQFGEGGAGTFSDGKLTTRINDKRCTFVLETLNKFGGEDNILYEAHPHIGTDKLTEIIVNMRKEIIRLGGEVHFSKKVADITVKDDKVTGVVLSDNTKLSSNIVVLAIGHSSRDTYNMLFKNKIFMEKKPFSVGFRIEHLRSFIDEGRFGKYAGHKNLGTAEYQLSKRDGERGCYTFCMCPGGQVIASNSEENTVVTNGMSKAARDMINSNSAVVASVLPDDFGNDLFSGMEFQRELEKQAYIIGGGNYTAPCQLSFDFLKGEKSKGFRGVLPSYPLGTEFCDFNKIFPEKITNMLKLGLSDFDKKIKGFSTTSGILTGIETRTSAPLRITRDEAYNSLSVKGLFPAGEGAGYAGGITSAAVDGLRIAEHIIENM